MHLQRLYGNKLEENNHETNNRKSSIFICVGDVMGKEIKNVLTLAALIVEHRQGDLETEDGSFAVTDLDTIINLEAALVEAFNLDSDDVSIFEIHPKILELPDADKLQAENEQLKRRLGEQS